MPAMASWNMRPRSGSASSSISNSSIDLSESSRTDRLADTVSYSNVVATATAAFKDANYKLLERAAGAVADAVLAAFPRISARQGHRAQAARADRRDFRRCRRGPDAHAAARPSPWLSVLIALGGNVGDVRATFQQGHRQYLRHDAGGAAGALVGLCHAALGRRAAGPLHQRLHRDRDRPRSACAAVHAAQDRSRNSAATAPRKRAGVRAPSTST